MLKRLIAVLVTITISLTLIGGVSYGHGDTKWKRLAHCESTHRWTINTGNGHYGGLQMSKYIWDAYRKGISRKRYPYLASRERQIRVARRIKNAEGWDQWAYRCRTYARYGYYPN